MVASLVPDFRPDAERHAAEQSPNEACGVVVNGRYWRCRNIADDPQLNFVLHPADYAAAALFGTVESVVHSHPMGGLASLADKKSCTGTKLPWHIYSMPEKQWSTIDP